MDKIGNSSMISQAKWSAAVAQSPSTGNSGQEDQAQTVSEQQTEQTRSVAVMKKAMDHDKLVAAQITNGINQSSQGQRIPLGPKGRNVDMYA